MSEVDRLLDEALSSYTACEPRAGLAGRVLAHVQAESHSRTRVWWAWGVAAGRLCCAVVVNRPRPVERMKIVIRPPAAPAEAYVVTRRVIANRPKPRHMLIAIVRFDPETAEWLTQTRKPLAIEPLEIGPLQIQPLNRGETK